MAARFQISWIILLHSSTPGSSSSVSVTTGADFSFFWVFTGFGADLAFTGAGAGLVGGVPGFGGGGAGVGAALSALDSDAKLFPELEPL